MPTAPLPIGDGEARTGRMDDLDRLEKVARERRSVRAFRPDPVDRTLVERAIAIAATAPSSCNTQPWRLHLVSGEPLERLRTTLVAAAAAGAPRAPEVESASPYEGMFRDRQVDAAVRLFEAQGVARHDKVARKASFLRNYAFFGAPMAAFMFVTSAGGPREVADCGKFLQTFLLALAAAGIGSCPQGSLSDYPGIVRDVLGLDEAGKLLLGISIGYADADDPSFAVRTSRMTPDDFAVFHEG